MAKDVVSELAETEKPELAEHEESAKRRQIMEGAREVFLAQGFDAASMGEIARRAGVSKGSTARSSYSRPLPVRGAGRRSVFPRSG
jgi:DNA-directed RNA polymerase specialized sigma24 family protein